MFRSYGKMSHNLLDSALRRREGGEWFADNGTVSDTYCSDCGHCSAPCDLERATRAVRSSTAVKTDPPWFCQCGRRLKGAWRRKRGVPPSQPLQGELGPKEMEIECHVQFALPEGREYSFFNRISVRTDRTFQKATLPHCPVDTARPFMRE
jgi:hypothetical protein